MKQYASHVKSFECMYMDLGTPEQEQTVKRMVKADRCPNCNTLSKTVHHGEVLERLFCEYCEHEYIFDYHRHVVLCIPKNATKQK
jgi:hypothetical protein